MSVSTDITLLHVYTLANPRLYVNLSSCVLNYVLNVLN